jgi:hypothetical protein
MEISQSGPHLSLFFVAWKASGEALHVDARRSVGGRVVERVEKPEVQEAKTHDSGLCRI